MEISETGDKIKRGILALSLPLIVLLIIVSLIGLLDPQIYRAAAPNWFTQTVAQDAVDLFLIVPVLIIGTLYSLMNSRVAMYLWVGSLMYLVYTFLIYCFAVHFNPLFIPYCLILGLSFFSLIWYFTNESDLWQASVSNGLMKSIGIYFIVVTTVFYTLWLMELVPASIADITPKSVAEAGLFTNPVHVLDLSIFLPGVFVVGVLALRRHRYSFTLAPIFLTFFILMNLTVATLSAVVMNWQDTQSYAVPIVMLVQAFISLILLIRFLSATNPN